jgi:RNA polymerase sigma-70 factor (ECF subfamily)
VGGFEEHPGGEEKLEQGSVSFIGGAGEASATLEISIDTPDTLKEIVELPEADPPTSTPEPAPARLPGARERNEVQILRDAVAGEQNAVRILLDVHMPTVYGFVMARLGGRRDSADDIMQETLEEAIKSAHSFRGESSLATWLCTIARRRLARMYDRERKAEENGRWLTPGQTVDDPDLDRRDEVTRALGALPPSQRQAVVLKYLDDLPVEKVAAEMGKTTVQVQSLLQRGRDGLKKELERVRG